MSWPSVLHNPASAGMYLGAVLAILIVILGACRRKTIDEKDVGYAAVAFLACSAIWPSIHLFNFAADPESAATLPEALHGYDPYLAAGGLVAFLLSVIGLVSAFVKTWKG